MLHARALLPWIPGAALALAIGCTGGPGSGSGGASATAQSGSGGGATGTSASAGGHDGGGLGGATGACTSCDGGCVDTANDPFHCGACDVVCGAAKPLCDRGECAPAPCMVPGFPCEIDHLCCGMECCPPWKICCNVPGGSLPTCVSVDAGACPTTCGDCG